MAALISFSLLACGGDGDSNGTEGDRAAGEAAAGEATAEAEAKEAARRKANAARARRLIALARTSQEGKSRKEQLRIFQAQNDLLLLAAEDLAAVSPLIVGLKQRDYDLISELHSFYIQLGQPGSEKILIEALNEQGFSHEGSVMALDFLASENKQLTQAARDWAESHGATITGGPSAFGATWASAGVFPP